ncbi:MAG: gluconate 2-dehydrogenase gamma chain [Gammaproteobacteria bacterium]|jgi:gluconate 2-dehydrogenase gamma chain|nr:gluconate 2-dehydrogenase gamma chain [Gammaproteobacteria bacterium]
MSTISRRSVLKLTGAIGATAALSTQQAVAAGAAGSTPRNYRFFNAEEGVFVEAAVARLIPADEEWGGAIEAGVPNYMDLQLGGAWGAGERLYRSGPWQPGIPGQGYQLPYTPAELFHKALAAIHKEPAGAAFAHVTPAQQDEFLKGLQTGSRDLGGVPGNVFFEQLWELTLEGFFSDPVYGGNRDMLSWRMIGFPGAYASYYDLVDRHGMKFDRPPMSLAEDASRHIHPDPNIPAYLPARSGAGE